MAVLSFTADELMVIVPWLTIPAPLVLVAVLLSTWLPLRTALPPLAMPPAAIGGPPPGPGVGTGAVAVFPFTWLRGLEREVAHTGRCTARSTAIAVAARDASTVEGAVAVTDWQ